MNTKMLDSQAESDVFHRVRLLLARRSLGQILAKSRLRVSVLIVLTCVFWSGMYWVFYEGFNILDVAIAHEATKAQMIHAIYNIFFLSLLAMLAVSSGIILYGLLFDSEEVRYLLTTPTSAQRIVLHKFQEAVVLSCWGFLLLGSPLLVAYGVEANAPWYYFVLLLPFLVSFVFLPAGIGAVACLVLVSYLPRARLHALVLAGLAFVAGTMFFGWSFLGPAPNDVMTPPWFQEVLTRLRYGEQRLLPSYWLSSGLLEAAHPTSTDVSSSWQESLGFLAVLVSNALLVPPAVAWTGGRLLRRGYSHLTGLSRSNRSMRRSLVDRGVCWTARALPTPIGLLFIKDMRLFRRDPLRWTQFLIFFGLLGLYFLNVRRFQYGDASLAWMTLIGFLNLGVVGLIQSTFTTRFIFPMISMEGRRFWILGTLPIDRDVILWEKLIFASVVSLVPCSLLILLSDFTLQILTRTPWVAMIHQVLCASFCIGLSAIAVGIGAKFPSFHEPSPAKIAAGFGGTLNLVVSATFVVLTVMLPAVATWLWVRYQGVPAGSPWMSGSVTFILGCILISLGLSVFASTVSLRAGFRAFRRLEP